MAVQGDVPVALANVLNILWQTNGSRPCQDTYCFFEDLLFRLFKVLGRPASEFFRCDFSGETRVARLHLVSTSLIQQAGMADEGNPTAKMLKLHVIVSICILSGLLAVARDSYFRDHRKLPAATQR